MFFFASSLFWVAFMALMPAASAGVAGLFPLLEKCQVTVNLEMMLCGACVAFDVSLLAMADITGRFSKSYAAANMAPLLAKWREFLDGFLAMGCTPFLVFDSLAYVFEPKVLTQQARRAVREKAAQELQKLKTAATGLSGAALEANQQKQDSAAKKMNKYSPDLQNALISLAAELRVPYTVAPSQADVQIAQLVTSGVAQYAFSGDGDVLVHGAPVLLRSIEGGAVGQVVNLSLALPPFPGVQDVGSLTDLFFFQRTRRPRLEVLCILRWFSVLAGCDYGAPRDSAYSCTWLKGGCPIEVGLQGVSVRLLRAREQYLAALAWPGAGLEG